MAGALNEIRRAFSPGLENGLDARYTLWDRGALFRFQERERAILSLLDRHGFRPLESLKFLDVGCGAGGMLRDLLKYGARAGNLVGVDLDHEQIARARDLAPHLDYRVVDASDLPLEDGSVDLALAFSLFSSITDPTRRKPVALEIARVLRPGGALLWYDFWINPMNRDVEALGLDEVRRLFGREPIEARRITLAPPLARLLAPRSWLACELLGRIPLFCTHWLALVRTR
jgi:ubiquinone/menaquinone biosynthesis C-methylase UbiE